MKVILASSNRGKLRELQKLLSVLDFELISQDELNLTDTPETGITFVENALIKARGASQQCGLPTIADDSGLVVPALGGAPGIYSARFAGTHGDDEANNQLLLQRLAGQPNRRAYFYCALVFVRSENDPAPVIATAAWHGEIASHPRGSHGFGYDPLFVVQGFTETSAELPSEVKNSISHRAIASQSLIVELGEVL